MYAEPMQWMLSAVGPQVFLRAFSLSERLSGCNMKAPVYTQYSFSSLLFTEKSSIIIFKNILFFVDISLKIMIFVLFCIL